MKDEFKIARHTDESYSLIIRLNIDTETNYEVISEIEAPSVFGARHAIETLYQLIEYDDLKGAYIIPTDVKIKDHPEFTHRGISLDTSRNFIEVETLEKIIEGMAHSKLNVFHWHIVDSHSFPMELKGDLTSKLTL